MDGVVVGRDVFVEVVVVVVVAELRIGGRPERRDFGLVIDFDFDFNLAFGLERAIIPGSLPWVLKYFTVSELRPSP